MPTGSQLLALNPIHVIVGFKIQSVSIQTLHTYCLGPDHKGWFTCAKQAQALRMSQPFYHNLISKNCDGTKSQNEMKVKTRLQNLFTTKSLTVPLLLDILISLAQAATNHCGMKYNKYATGVRGGSMSAFNSQFLF